MRKIAEGMAHLPRAQASLLETAQEYDRRAAKAEKRLSNKPRPRLAVGALHRNFSNANISGDAA